MEGIVNEYIQAQHKLPNVVVRSSSKELLHYMAVRGYVYPFLTKNIISGWKDLNYRQVSFVTPSQVRLMWPASVTQRPAIKTFISFMKEASMELNNPHFHD